MKKTIASTICLILFTAPAWASPVFSVQIMDDLSGHNSSSYDINNLGQIAGTSRDQNGDYYAVHWDPEGNIYETDIKGYARGINNHGNMAIWGTPTTVEGAIFWDKNTGKVSIPVENHAYSYATGINDANQVVGQSFFPDADHFIWSEKDGTQFLPAPDGGGLTSRATINNKGQVTGFYVKDNIAQPYLWDPDTGLQLIDLKVDSGFNLGLNDTGKIAGAIYSQASGKYTSYTWDKINGVQYLSISAPFNGSFAGDINNRNEIIGSFEFYGQNNLGGLPDYTSAAYWDDSGSYEIDDLIDFSDPLFNKIHFTRASSINDLGQVAVEGTFLETGERRLFLLSQSSTTVPEPLPLFLIGFGLISIALLRRGNFLTHKV